MNTDVEEIKDIDGIDVEDAKNEEPEKVYDDIKKWNSKVVTPAIVLSTTLFIALYTYFKHYPVGVWIRILLICVCIFLILGSIIERMIAKFVDVNYEKAVAQRREEERLEAERQAAMEAEGAMGPEIITDDEKPPLV